jgi:hypothetical protein
MFTSPPDEPSGKQNGHNLKPMCLEAPLGQYALHRDSSEWVDLYRKTLGSH